MLPGVGEYEASKSHDTVGLVISLGGDLLLVAPGVGEAIKGARAAGGAIEIADAVKVAVAAA